MTDTNDAPDRLSRVCQGLGWAILERELSASASWRAPAAVPEWFERALGPLDDGFPSRSPFLEDFVVRLDEDAPTLREPLRSGLWTEPDGAAYEASGWREAERLCLCLERADERLAQEQRYAQRLHEDALEKRRLAREIEKKELLLDCIVHDLSGPLGTILMNLRQVSRQVDRPDLARGLERAIGQAERQRALIHCIGEVFAADLPVPVLAQSLRLQDSGIEWLALARRLVEAHEAGAREKGVGLRVEGDERWSPGEPRQAARLLENLLMNAIRHSPAGGTVAISVAGDEARTTVCVLDEGPGVAESERARLFRPYTKAGGPGGQAGLGLYYCHLTATLWGGTVTYEGRETGGACFRISLPAADAAESEEARP